MEEKFADGLIGVVVSGHVVKLDFASQAMPGEISSEALARAGASHPDRTPMVPRQRITMPIEGFAQSFGLLEQIMAKLVADGLVKKTASGVTVAPAGGSPNFPEKA